MSDFIGMATVYDVECTDGRFIGDGSFDHQDGQQVPIVWRHEHDVITNFLGFAILHVSQNPRGMRVEATFNNSAEGRRAKMLVDDGTITHLSIYANEIKEFAIGHGKKRVEHGYIREVSLVLSGANPGARIEDVIHSEYDSGYETELVVFDGVIAHGGIIETRGEDYAEATLTVEEESEDVETETVEDSEEVETEAVEESEDVETETVEDVETEATEESEDVETETVEEVEDVETETVEETGNDVEHFGIPGMKWGKHKAQDPQVSRDPNSPQAKWAAEHNKSVNRDVAILKKVNPELAATIKNSSFGSNDFADLDGGPREYTKTGAAAKKSDSGAKLNDEEPEEGKKSGGGGSKKSDEEEKESEKSEKSGKGGGSGKSDKESKDKKDDKSDKEKQKMYEELAETQAEHAKLIKEEAKRLREESVTLSEKSVKMEADSKVLEAESIDARKSGDTEKADQLLAESKRMALDAQAEKTKAAEQAEAAEKLEDSAKDWADKAEKSSGKAKKLKHEDDPDGEEIFHELMAEDATVRDIVNTFTEDQLELLALVIHTSAAGETLPPATPIVEDQFVYSPTVQEVFDSLSEPQKNILYYVAGTVGQYEYIEQEDKDMSTNIFAAQFQEKTESQTLAHEQQMKLQAVLEASASRRPSSLRETLQLAEVKVPEIFPSVLAHSITDVSNFFPEAQNVHGAPEFLSRPMEWVETVLGATSRRPFARIKSRYADITADAARAKGFVAGNQKAQEVIIALKRVTTPQTIYKLQKMDRDDLLDITDFDIVIWLKNEMRLMLREELARAILISDGRADTGNDAILSTNIRPIVSDDATYTIQFYHNDVGNEQVLSAFSALEMAQLVDAIAVALDDYRGKGSPVFYCQPEVKTRMLISRDANYRRMYQNEQELASALGVAGIVAVPPMSGMSEAGLVDPTGLPAGTYTIATLGVIVNLADYVIGMDRGGETNFFEDFDINYNVQAFLYETRLSGALVSPKAAIAVKLVTAKTA